MTLKKPNREPDIILPSVESSKGADGNYYSGRVEVYVWVKEGLFGVGNWLDTDKAMNNSVDSLSLDQFIETLCHPDNPGRYPPVWVDIVANYLVDKHVLGEDCE